MAEEIPAEDQCEARSIGETGKSLGKGGLDGTPTVKVQAMRLAVVCAEEEGGASNYHPSILPPVREREVERAEGGETSRQKMGFLAAMV